MDVDAGTFAGLKRFAMSRLSSLTGPIKSSAPKTKESKITHVSTAPRVPRTKPVTMPLVLTLCDETICDVDEYVSANACAACPAGTTNVGGDNAAGEDTTCDDINCGVDQYVSANTCTACLRARPT